MLDIVHCDDGTRLASLHDGNYRLAAACELGIPEVPLRIACDLDSTFPGYPYDGRFDHLQPGT